jgi:hypothetical protein
MAREERLSPRRHREGGNLTMLARGYIMTKGLRGDRLGGFNVLMVASAVMAKRR